MLIELQVILNHLRYDNDMFLLDIHAAEDNLVVELLLQPQEQRVHHLSVLLLLLLGVSFVRLVD